MTSRAIRVPVIRRKIKKASDNICKILGIANDCIHTASSSSAAAQKPNPRPAPATPSNGPPANKPAQAQQKLQRPPKQANPPPPKYPVDSKQKITVTPPAQYPNPTIYNPRPHKKNPSTGAPDNLYPRPASTGRPGEQSFYGPQAVPSSSNQYLRPASPMPPGAWPSTSPSPTPPPPSNVSGSQQNGDHKHQSTIAHGASTMVQGLLGFISTGKTK